MVLKTKKADLKLNYKEINASNGSSADMREDGNSSKLSFHL